MILTKSTALLDAFFFCEDEMRRLKNYLLFFVCVCLIFLFPSCETTTSDEENIRDNEVIVTEPASTEVTPPIKEEEPAPVEVKSDSEETQPEPAVVEPAVTPEPVASQEPSGEEVAVQEPTPVVEPEPEPVIVPEPEPEKFTVSSFVEGLNEKLATGSIEESLAFFEEIPEEFENDFSLNYLQAALNISSGNYTKASTITSKLIDEDPENTDLLMLQVMIEKANGNTKNKQALLKKVVELEPFNTDANTELGDEQMLKKNFKTANTYYLKALSGDANNIDALAGYGQSSYYLNKISEADKTFRRMLDLDPENAFAWSYLSKLQIERMDYKAALGYAEKAVQYNPGYYDYWVEYGTCLKNVGKTTEAEMAWTKAIEIKPNYFLAYVYRGGLYDELNRKEDAVADYLVAAKVNPNYYYAFEALGILYWGLGKWSDSRYWFEKISAVYPSNESYQMIAVASYFMEGLTKDGKNYVSKTCLKTMDRASVEYALMRLFYDNVAPGTVANKIQAEANINKRGKYLYYLGLYYQTRGNDSLAQKYYISVTEIESPSFFEYRLAEWAIEKYSGQ